jgi:predicted RNase H-like HicB family nuclease
MLAAERSVIDEYPVYIVSDKGGSQFCSYVPDFPGCMAFGETHEAVAAVIDHHIRADLANASEGLTEQKPGASSNIGAKVLDRDFGLLG